MEEKRLTLGALVSVICLCIVWGGAVVAIKVGLRDAPPFLFSGLRMVITTLVFFLLSRQMGLSFHIPAQNKVFLFLVAGGFFLNISFVYVGVNYTTAGRANVIMNTSIFFVLILAHFFLNEKININKLIGIVLCSIGVFVIFKDKLYIDGSNTFFGDLLVLMGSIFWAICIICTKILTRSVNPVYIVFFQTAFGIIPTFIISFIVERGSHISFSGSLIFSLLYMSVATQVYGQVVWNKLLKEYDASKISTLSFIQPIVGVILSGIILKEALTLNLLGGAVLVGVGVYIVNKKVVKRKAMARKPVEEWEIEAELCSGPPPSRRP